mgnify:CR=1 FL=1
MSKPFWKSEANVSNNGDFISIQTYSGYSLAMIDPEAKEHLLSPGVSDEELGKSILEALGESRFLPIEEARTLRLNTEQNYKNWIEQIKARYGYKTKNALFKKMMSCGIQLDDGIITIRPSLHEKLEAWSGDGIREEDYVKIPADSPPAEIGAALRLAFKRCRGAKPDEYK